MIWKNNTLYNVFEPDSGADGGGDAGTDPTPVDPSPSPVDPAVPPAEPSVDPAPAPAPTPAPDTPAFPTAGEIASAVRDATAPEPAPLTQEQIDAQLQRYRPNQQFLQTILGSDVPDEQKLAALDELVQGIFRYSLNASTVASQGLIDRLKNELAPSLSAAQSASASQQQNAFYSKYPELKGREQLVNLVSAQLKSRTDLPNDRDKVFELLASSVKEHAKQLGVVIDAPASQASKPAQLSTGGVSGGAAPQTPRNSRISAIWD